MNLRNIKIPALLALVLITALSFAGPSYRIQVKVTGAKKDSLCFLGHYYGASQYLIQDTAKPDAEGKFVFEGNKTLPGGIYLIVINNKKKQFEVIIDKEQVFSIETDTADFIKHMKVKGSKENQYFYEYHQFIASKHKEIEPLRTQLKKIKSKDSIEVVQKKMKKIDEEVKLFQREFPQKHKELFLAKVFMAMQEPEVPEAPLIPGTFKKDSLFPFRYYRAHFWDGFDFSDDRLLRTPIFEGKMKRWLEQLTMQTPDSINSAADHIAEKARANREVFKYIVANITYTYETSKIMGFDAVFAHMAKRYYCTKQAWWIADSTAEKICKRGLQIDRLLLGRPFAPLTLIDTLNRPISLYDIKSKYTIVYFWDPTCGHCKKDTPKLNEMYNDKLKTRGVTVYSIANENEYEKWKVFIKEHKLNTINVMDQKHSYDFREQFDIYAYPVVYLLDENKVIKAKRLGIEQLEEVLDALDKQEKMEKQKKSQE